MACGANARTMSSQVSPAIEPAKLVLTIARAAFKLAAKLERRSVSFTDETLHARRAAVEAEPADPEEGSAEDDVRERVRGVGELLGAIAAALAKEVRDDEAGRPGDDLYGHTAFARSAGP